MFLGCGLHIPGVVSGGSVLPINPADTPTQAGLPGIDLGTGVIYYSRYVFHNSGTDYIDFGRPTGLSFLRPGVDEFTIKVSSRCASAANTGYILALRDTSSSPVQFAILQAGSAYNVYSGSSSGAAISNAVTSGFDDIILKSSLTNLTVYVNGVRGNTVPVGTELGITNLYLGGRTDGASANFEGDTCCNAYFTGVGDFDSASLTGCTLLERFSLNQSSGTTVVGYNGTTGTITDGSPTGVWSLAWVPYSLAF